MIRVLLAALLAVLSPAAAAQVWGEIAGTVTEASTGDHWCGKAHNEDEYTSDDAATLVAEGLAPSVGKFKQSCFNLLKSNMQVM